MMVRYKNETKIPVGVRLREDKAYRWVWVEPDTVVELPDGDYPSLNSVADVVEPLEAKAGSQTVETKRRRTRRKKDSGE